MGQVENSLLVPSVSRDDLDAGKADGDFAVCVRGVPSLP